MASTLTPLKWQRLRNYLRQPVIPILPFLVAGRDNDKRANAYLNAIAEGGPAGIPNTIQWCERFGTTGPKLLPEPACGRSLVSDEEDADLRAGTSILLNPIENINDDDPSTAA